MKWNHPELGDIGEMREREQELKGWKHLYDPLERWEQLIGVSAETLHSQARANGCGEWRRPLQGEWHPGLSRSCRRCLFRHHDQLWRDAYGEALLDPRSRIGRDRFWTGNPVVLASPRGVWLVLRLNGERVFNAFRPHPPGRGVDWEEEDFAAEADRRFERNTGASMRDRSQLLQRQLKRPVDAWHLALAVAAAQLDPQPADAEALRDAIARLGALPRSVREEALPARGDLLDALEAVLDERNEELEDTTNVVLAMEDALVATEVLLGEGEAIQLQEALEGLVAWAPEAWLGLQPVVEARAQETAGAAQSWWRTVGETLSALELGGVQPIHVPDSPLARLLTAPPWWERLTKKFSSLAHGLVEPVALGIDVGVAQLGSDDELWEVTGPELPAGVQLFVVDAKNPDGDPVTEDLVEKGPFWQLEVPGQEAYVVWIEGVSPCPDLVSALEQASRSPGARVQVALVSRPS